MVSGQWGGGNWGSTNWSGHRGIAAPTRIVITAAPAIINITAPMGAIVNADANAIAYLYENVGIAIAAQSSWCRILQVARNDYAAVAYTYENVTT